jgi:hypothetical protein
MKMDDTMNTPTVPRTDDGSSSDSEPRPSLGSSRKWLARALFVSCALALTGCAVSIPAHADPVAYELLDKDGPTAVKVTGFVPSCTSSCLDEIVRTELGSVSAASIAVAGSSTTAPRRWISINVDQRNTPKPVSEITGCMIGADGSRKCSSMSAPAYDYGPPAVFCRSVANFISRFVG